MKSELGLRGAFAAIIVALAVTSPSLADSQASFQADTQAVTQSSSAAHTQESSTAETRNGSQAMTRSVTEAERQNSTEASKHASGPMDITSARRAVMTQQTPQIQSVKRPLVRHYSSRTKITRYH